MRMVVTGGGSGGHITPLLAVARELKQLQGDMSIAYIGQKGDGFLDIVAQDESIDTVYTVNAGKFRRYHGEGWRQLLDLETVFKNLRDMAFVAMGFWQSFWLLKKIKPSAVFVKGGYVGMPVGLSAALLRIPYVTHDSDALPGLANRLIAPWAAAHAVALPKDVYRYPVAKTTTVGVPLAHYYKPVTEEAMKKAREQAGLPAKGKIVLVTGGSLGAQRLNDAVAACLPELLDKYPDLTVVQLAGRANEAPLRQRYKKELVPQKSQRVIVHGYVTNSHVYSAAADLIVTRAGATSMAEFAAQRKACVVVPNPLLTGGHQMKNAKVLADHKAIRMVSEDVLKEDDHALMPAITDLLDHPEARKAMGVRLGEFAHEDAARRLAMLLLDVARTK